MLLFHFQVNLIDLSPLVYLFIRFFSICLARNYDFCPDLTWLLHPAIVMYFKTLQDFSLYINVYANKGVGLKWLASKLSWISKDFHYQIYWRLTNISLRRIKRIKEKTIIW